MGLVLRVQTVQCFEQDGLLVHFLPVLLLGHLLGEHWLTSLAEQELFNWMQFPLLLEHFFGTSLCFHDEVVLLLWYQKIQN